MIEDKINALIEQPLNSLGYELVRIKLIGNDVIQVMLDSDAGINIQDCTKATRLINNILHVAEIDGYGLEVSSPGIDRPLITAKHFLKHIDFDIKITLNELVDNKKRFIGKLKKFNQENNDIEVAYEDKLLIINLKQIQSATLYYQPTNKQKSKKELNYA